MTSKKQTSHNTKGQLMFFPEDSHASHSQQQESEKVQRMIETSGRKCLERFEKLSHVGYWQKMFAASLIGMEGWFSTRCRLTWKLKVTRSYRFYFQLQVSTPHTKGIESGLLPTVAARDYRSGFNPGKKAFLKRQKHSRGVNLHEYLQRNVVGKNFQLNPLFTAEMMGFPPDYLELPFQGTEKNP